MMRALVVAGTDSEPSVQKIPIVDPGSEQVMVITDAASINGIDAATAAGHLWDAIPRTFPVVLGRDFVGTVEAAGDDVTGFQPGDRVAGTITGMTPETGTIAETVTVDADLLTAVPDTVTNEQAAATGLAAVAAHDLVTALSLTADDVVLVAGATGGVGAYAVQLAAATGATVLATARPGPDADFVRDRGAARAVDHTGDLAATVTEAAAPRGLTAVVHAAGDPAALAALLTPGGRLASVLGATDDQAGRDDVTVTQVYAVATPEKVASLLAAVAEGKLHAPIRRTYELDRATEALADFGRHKLGKLVVSTH